MNLTQDLQVINSIFLIWTLPFSISLLATLIRNNHRPDFVRYVLMLIFFSITIAALFSLHLNYLLIVKDKNAEDVLLEAGVRNLVKNFAFLITSIGFWLIEKRR